MTTDSFQANPYGSDTGPYGGEYGYDGPGQYEGAASGGYDAPSGRYGGYGYTAGGYAAEPVSAEYRYDAPTADHRLYGRGADSASGGYDGGGYDGGGYPVPAAPANYGSYPDPGYGAQAPRYPSDTPGYDGLAGQYGQPGPYQQPAQPSQYAQYQQGQYQQGQYQPQSQYSQPSQYDQLDQYAAPAPPAAPPYSYAPPAGYTNGQVHGYGTDAPSPGYTNGQVLGYGSEAPLAGQPTGQPAAGYQAAAAAIQAPPAPNRNAYPAPAPPQYAVQPGAGVRPGMPGPGTQAPPGPGAPDDWYRPNRRPAEATSVIPVTEDEDSELFTIEGEIQPRPGETPPRDGRDGEREPRSAGAVVRRSTSTEIARPQDVIPSVEIAVKNRQGARKESRLSEGMQRRLVILTFVAGFAGTMYMWWLGSYEGSLDSYENLAAGVAQIAGLVGEYLILVQVLLMARVPLLERAIGTEHLTRAHVIIGFSVMTFITEHIIGAIVLNSPPGVSPVAGVAGVILGLRDVLTATVGAALLFGVVYLSTKRMRQRIPYEVWRYLHLFVYLGIMLEFIHQLTLGVHFLNSKAALVYWLALHAITFFAVAWYRFGVIIRMNLRHRLRVDRVAQEGPGVYSVYFTGNRLDKFEGTAGQFCRWRFMNREGWWQSHPFSLSAAPTSQYLRITVKQLGDWTKMHMPDLEEGTPVIFSGPYGGLTPSRRKRRKVLLVAAGIGITPMRSLLAGLPADPGDITLLYRASSEKDLVFRAELDELARQRGATVHYLVGPRDQFPGGDPLGAESLRSLIPGVHRHDVYLCGPEGMLTAAIQGLRGARVPRRQIHTERFAF